VLVENLRPGALAKLGFDRRALADANPRLVYCSISGFGVRTAYPERPAFDTVIQAMSGLMDLTRSEGEPVKIGASAADILGGQAALFAIAARLAAASDGAGKFIEIGMQDVAAWTALFAAGRPGAKQTEAVDATPVRISTYEGMFSTATDPDGRAWRVVKLPYRLSRNRAGIRRAPGAPETHVLHEAASNALHQPKHDALEQSLQIASCVGDKMNI
jgi:crotonobetainyl-CoA:carnitine CoA-transferase CaiB-like acyl-CoA transferase